MRHFRYIWRQTPKAPGQYDVLDRYATTPEARVVQAALAWTVALQTMLQLNAAVDAQQAGGLLKEATHALSR